MSAAPATAAGSPGPLDRNTPSGPRASTSAAGVEAGANAGYLGRVIESGLSAYRTTRGVADTELATPSWFWEDKGYPIRFRMHRFEEHLRQHTIQVDKTLVALGHPPTEAERLVRNLYTALAGLESVGGAGVGNELLAECAAKVDAIAIEVERIAG